MSKLSIPSIILAVIIANLVWPGPEGSMMAKAVVAAVLSAVGGVIHVQLRQRNR